MKKPSVFSFIISLLLVAAVCAHGQELVKLVRDTDGNPVKVGEKYYIQSVKTASNNGGGLVPAEINIFPRCPLGIDQTLDPNQPGVPVSFKYPYAIERDTFVVPSIVNIKFESDIWPVCNEFSKFWEVDVSSSAAKEPAILIGGKPRAINSMFKIERAGEGTGTGPYTYKFTTSNGTVGTTPGWHRPPQVVLLTHSNVDDKTLLVKFYKFHVPTTATTSTSRVEKLGLRMFPF